MAWWWIALGALLALAAGLLGRRLADAAAARRAWRRLGAAAEPARVDPDALAALAEPARRFFAWSLADRGEAPTAAEIRMAGELTLGAGERARHLPMTGYQILAVPHGFVWICRAGSAGLRIAGSDGLAEGTGWTRFWLLGLLPVVRAQGARDMARSAAGRAVAEAVFWTPGALLPGPTVTWTGVDADTARAHVHMGGHVHELDLAVAADGAPVSVTLRRWSRENAERTWRLQPFGGTVDATMRVDGVGVAARITGGNGFGTDAYAPFYRAGVTRLRFPSPDTGGAASSRPSPDARGR